MFKHLKLLWPFYASTFIQTAFSLVSIYFILYFLDQGLSFFQVSLLLSISTFVTVFFDIPTGAVADIIGRKYAVIVSYLSIGVFLFLIPLSSNFAYLIVLMIFWGIAETLSTGSYEAWVVDSVKKQTIVEEYYAVSLTIANVGIVIAPLLAAFVVKYSSMNILFFITGSAFFLSALVLFFARERFKKKKVRISSLYKESLSQAKETLVYASKKKPLLYLLIAGSLAGFSITSIGIGWQPYLQSFNIPLEYFGYTFSIAGFISIFVPILTSKLSKKCSKQSYLALVACLTFILMVATSVIDSHYFAMLAIILLYLSFMFILPIEGPLFQSLVPSNLRATAGSVRTTLLGITSGIGILVAGVIMDLIGVRYVFVLMSILLLPAAYYYRNIDS